MYMVVIIRTLACIYVVTIIDRLETTQLFHSLEEK
jgi:hypothetical protein